MMRQAGRSLPEYREVRKNVDFVTLYRTPDLAARVSLQPLERLGVDAVIFFSDILVPAEAMGLEVAFRPGPVLEHPVRDAGAVARLVEADPRERVPFVYETLRILARELRDRVPLIGFAATPMTLAAYLVEGRGNKGFPRFKEMLFREPALAHELLAKLARTTRDYLAAQIEAGASAVQLFDSWAGLLSERDYREFSLPYVRDVLEPLGASGAPRIYFALDAAHLYETVAASGADVIGVDWRVDLPTAARRIGAHLPLQGNLDPTVLFGSRETVTARAREILEEGRTLPGHVFNLGHGVLPDTPLENLEHLVRTVQEAGGAA